MDTIYMNRCLQLASFGAGYVSPNPMVGAVLVCDGKIIGEGYHQKYGKAHAEPNVIQAVEDKTLLKKATLYVNLEPCAHFGKTPPCANLIVECGIPCVVIGTLDPNPQVVGRGVEILKKAGVEVRVGVLEEECRALNKRFFTYQTQKRPYIVLKWAQTQDGFIDKIRNDASESPLQISNFVTRQLAHKLRSENQSILIGTNTAILDNPSLTVRHWSGKNPVRLILDHRRRIAVDYLEKYEQLPTIIFTEQPSDDKPNLRFVKMDFSENVLEQLISIIYDEKIHSVLVEGGAQLLNSFIEKGCWDEAYVEVAPVRIAEGVPVPVLSMQPASRKTVENHECLFFQNEYII